MTLRSTFRAAHVAPRAIAVTLSACGGTGSSGSGSGETVTVYSADGLATWYKPQFDAFTKDTGINVNLVEAGSGEVVSRVEKEQSNPQADLLVTLPPFIQKADKSGLLQPSGVDTKRHRRRAGRSRWQLPAGRQQRAELHRQPRRQPAAGDVGRPAVAGIQGQASVFDAGPGRRRHRGARPAATPHGQAGRAGLPGQAAGEQRRAVLVDRQAAAQGEQRRAAGGQRRRADEPRLDQGRRLEVRPSSSPRPPTARRPRCRCPTSAASRRAPRTPTARRSCSRSWCRRTCRRRSPLTPSAFRSSSRSPRRPRRAGPNTPAGVLQGVDVWVPDWNAVLADLDADVAAYQKVTGS